MAGGRQFHLPGLARIRFRPRAQARAVSTGGLGILRDPEVRVLRRGKELVLITPEIMEFLNEPRVLIITKANVRSRVHRRVHMDYIGVKRFDATAT